MPKVLFLPLNYGEVVQDGWYDAFRQAGCHLDIFDYYFETGNKKGKRQRVQVVRNSLIEKAKQVKPDLIFMQIQHTDIIDAGTIIKIKQMMPKTIIANWTGDVRTYIPRTYKAMTSVSDYNFISSTGQLSMFKKEIKRNIQYLQIGYNPKLYYPDTKYRKAYKYDVVFIGNNTTKENYPGRAEREETCRLLRGRFKDRFLLHGHGWPRNLRSKGSISQRHVLNAYHNSFCTISVSHFNDISHYFSDRLLMCLASGRPTVSLKFPSWESYFTDNCDLVIANSPQDIVKKVEHLLANRELAEYIGKSGAEKVRSEHTYLSRVNELLDIVGLK